MNGQATATPLHAGWLDWVADNRLRGCTQDSMVAAMATRGITPFDAVAAIAAVQGSPGFRAAERLAQRLRKLESVLAHQHATWALAPGAGSVARRVSVTRDEFLRDFVAASRPLVLTGLAADWPALERWAPEQLAERYGEVIVEVQSGREADPDFELNKLRHRSEMPLATLVQRVRAGAGNDLYLTANNQALKRPSLAPLLHDVGGLPDWVDRAALPGAALLWLGGAGTKTPLHHDTLMLLHTQVVGRKLWHLASPLQTPCLYNTRGVFSPVDLAQPDLQRHPAAGAVQVLEVVLEPGETLFVPVGWWHQVRSLDVSVSLSYTNLDLPNHFDYHHPVAVAP
jgi:Cupin-like domain